MTKDLTQSIILSTYILYNVSYHRAILMLENQEITNDILQQSIIILTYYIQSIILLIFIIILTML